MHTDRTVSVANVAVYQPKWVTLKSVNLAISSGHNDLNSS